MKGRQTLKDIKEKISSYCASQDRCHSEVRTKLVGMRVYGDDLEEIISALVADGFLNEERYARSFARGKFRINQWGRIKIAYALRGKKVPEYCIEKGLMEIDEEEYITQLDDLLRKQLKGSFTYESKGKAAAALQRKGFEAPLIWERMKHVASGM
jgi:regulatory protein